MLSFLICFILCAAGLLISTLLLSSLGLGDAWLIFGVIFGGAVLAGLLMLREKLNWMEKKLDKLSEQEEEE